MGCVYLFVFFLEFCIGEMELFTSKALEGFLYKWGYLVSVYDCAAPIKEIS
jgi:hypothetical protein